MMQRNILQKTLDQLLYPYLGMEDVEDVSINKPKEVFCHFAGGRRERFEDDKLTLSRLTDLAVMIATNSGQVFNKQGEPLSSQLPDGTRIEIFKSPCVENGLCLTARKRQPHRFGLADFGFDEQQIEYIRNAVLERKTILVSGGTSTGKTTVLEILCNIILEDTRIISIQDPIEMQFKHPNHCGLTVPSMTWEDRQRELAYISATVKRQNPDIIIVGEIREGTMAYTFKDAINSGHPGSMSTIHANNPEMALRKMKDFILQFTHSGIEADAILNDELRRNIHLVIQVERTADGGRRGYYESFTD